ncbi:MAG: helix-turn-helix domain-containing protein [Deltaproteobacteria bacterium]|nr:helix-turn-helix domain-containing protein [Deltaproteobacteria bacterium]
MEAPKETRRLPEVMTVKEASQYCMVSTETIRRWIKNNDLKAFNTNGRGIIKIRLEDLRNFTRSNNMLTVEDQ